MKNINDIVIDLVIKNYSTESIPITIVDQDENPIEVGVIAQIVGCILVTIGRMFLEDTFQGLIRFGAFHEHIACTVCDAQYDLVRSFTSQGLNTQKNTLVFHELT